MKPNGLDLRHVTGQNAKRKAREFHVVLLLVHSGTRFSDALAVHDILITNCRSYSYGWKKKDY